MLQRVSVFLQEIDTIQKGPYQLRYSPLSINLCLIYDAISEGFAPFLLNLALRL